MLLDIRFDDAFLEFLILDLQKVDLAQIPIQLVQVFHVVIQTSDCELVIVVGIPHCFVPTLYLLQPSQLCFDWDFQVLFRLERIDIPIKPLHLQDSFFGLFSQDHEFVPFLLGKHLRILANRSRTLLEPIPCGPGESVRTGSTPIGSRGFLDGFSF